MYTEKVRKKIDTKKIGHGIIFKVYLSELVFYLALIVNIMYSVFYPVYLSIHEYYTYMVWASAFLIFICRKKIRSNAIKIFGIVAFIAINSVIILVNGSGVGVLIQIIWPLCIIYMFKNLHLSDRYINRINILMIIGWLLSIIGSLSYTNVYFENFEQSAELEGINPNTIAIIIVTTCLFLELYIEGKSKSRLLEILIYIISFLALLRTRARTSLVAFFIILVMEMILKKQIERSKKLSLLLITLVVVAGIIFPFIYVGLYMKGIITSDTLFLGKKLFTGRQYIWANLWHYLKENHAAFIWGVGYNTELYSKGTFNIHNAFLMVFAQYGLFTVLLYLAYIFYSTAKMYGKSKRISDLQFKCYQILIYVLIVGFGETVFSYLPNLIFIAMAIGIGYRERLEVTVR